MLLSLADAIESWNERNSKDEKLCFDVMAVVTCRRDEALNNTKSGRYRRLGLADPQARASFRLSDTISSSTLPVEGSVILLYSVFMQKVAQEVELRQDGRTHEGPLWQVLLPHNATGEQRQQNEQAARLWTWWQQQNVNSLSLPKCVDRTLGEMSLTPGMNGHIVAYVSQVQVCHPKQLHKRKTFSGGKAPQVCALLKDTSRKTYISLVDRTGMLLQKLEQAKRTQELIRVTSVKSATGNGEELVLVTTPDTVVHLATKAPISDCCTPESQALQPEIPFSPPPEIRVTISPLYRFNGSTRVQYLPPGQNSRLEIESETVVATYASVREVLSCGGDLPILQALIDEAIPLRWSIRSNGTVAKVSLVGFPLNKADGRAG